MQQSAAFANRRVLARGAASLLAGGHTSPHAQYTEIPNRGKPHQLDNLDVAFICVNELGVTLYTYHFVRFLNKHPYADWNANELTLSNTVVALAGLHLVYDFFYWILHWVMHTKFLYPHIHKHHHKQVVSGRTPRP